MRIFIAHIALFLTFIQTMDAQNCLANFTFTGSPGGMFSYQFMDSSVIGQFTNDTIHYFWDFGDGNFSSQQNPVHAYATSGNYNVCLTVSVVDVNNTNFTLCTDSLCKIVPVSSGCNASFSFLQSSVNPFLISFYDSSSAQMGFGNPLFATIDWFFGDGISVTGQSLGDSVVHIYNGPGTYNVCLFLNVQDTNGAVTCTDSFCTTIVIQSPIICQSAFSWRGDSLNNRTINFTDSSTYNSSAGQTDSIVWDFGDGNTGLGTTIQHTYFQSGAYNVCHYLFLLDSSGDVICTDSICRNIVVAPNDSFCSVNYIIDTVNSYSGVVYIWNVSDPANNDPDFVNTYQWDFGDGTTSNNAYPTHNYSSVGAYKVCVTLTSTNTNNDLCVKTFCDSIIVDNNGVLSGKNGSFQLNVLKSRNNRPGQVYQAYNYKPVS